MVTPAQAAIVTVMREIGGTGTHVQQQTDCNEALSFAVHTTVVMR